MEIIIRVSRNAFGRQQESFETELMIRGIDQPVPGVFIHAPLIIQAVGIDMKVLAFYRNRIAVKQGTLLATSFHPELPEDTSLHSYFLQMVRESKS